MVEPTQITPMDDEPEIKEVFDFNCREAVLIEVVPDDSAYEKFDWLGWKVEWATIISSDNDEVSGAASHEQAYGGFLEYMIEGMVECPKAAGWYVVEGVTGHYTRGDGWTTDDDMDYYYESMRPATAEEIENC